MILNERNIMKNDQFFYLPLGGAGEIGMNCYIYGFGKSGQERLIVVDFGVAFPDSETTPGVDLILPDLEWLIKRREQIEGIFLTHAHEDHIGALGLFPELTSIPVYARPFTAANAKRKLVDRGIDEKIVKIISPYPNSIQLGPFNISFLPVSHSIPESSGLVIQTSAGKVFHTGDFKLDRTPVLGDPYDSKLWKSACKNLDILVCDSTNVLETTVTKSEKSLKNELVKLIKAQNGMVVATTFASNIARLKTLADAAIASDRSIVLLGRAMRRMIELALESGIIEDFPHVISTKQALELPRSHVFILSTGSQGERRAASAQLANGKYQGITLLEGDTFLFSSKTIPGNEVSVNNVINKLSEKKVDVVENQGGLYHVSGHANRTEITAVHNLLKPRIIIPMHGEARHLRAHQMLARENGFESILAANGSLIDISKSKSSILDQIESGRVYLDGDLLISSNSGVVRDRLRMSFGGHVSINIILDEDDDLIEEVWVKSHGLIKNTSETSLDILIEETVLNSLKLLKEETLLDDEVLEKIIVKAVRGTVLNSINKKPEVTVLINRLISSE